MWALDALRDVGSAAGLVAAFFLIRDKLLHEWPSFFFVRLLRVPGRKQADPALRIVNRSARQLLLSITDASRPGYFSPALGRSTDEIMAYADPGQSMVLLEPEERRDLLLVQPPGFDELLPDARIVAEVRWRRLEGLRWPLAGIWHIARLSLRKRDLEVLAKGHVKVSES